MDWYIEYVFMATMWCLNSFLMTIPSLVFNEIGMEMDKLNLGIVWDKTGAVDKTTNKQTKSQKF